MIIDTLSEEYRDIPGYEDLYKVSNRGNIISCITHKLLSPWINNRGYLCVKLYRNNNRSEYKVHQLVLKAYDSIGETRIRNEVHHVDENKLNNNLSNLKWCSRKKNMKYMHESKKNKKNDTTKIKGPF